MSSDDLMVSGLSETALRGIIRDLSKSGQMPDRLRAAQAELNRKLRTQKP